MNADSDDDEDLFNPGARRLREREQARAARADAARAAIRRAGANPPDDFASPPEVWRDSLGDAVDSLLRAEWPDEWTTPDGVTPSLLTATESGFAVEAVLYLLPTEIRLLRLEFDADGECLIRVAAADASSAAVQRLDPRRPAGGALTFSTR